MTINPNNQLHQPLSTNQQLAQLLIQRGNRMHITKGTCILKEGETVDFVFLVESGCFRTFRYLHSNEVTLGFSFAGDLDTCPFAFIHQQPSTDVIEALADSIVVKVHRSIIEELQTKYPTMNLFIQHLLSQYIETLIQRNISLRTASAEKRYAELHNRQPKEVSKIPLMYIASYLGITKERLSRIRKSTRID